MKKILPRILLVCLLVASQQSSAKDGLAKDAPLFTENKGQLADQHNKLRSDIHYYGSSDGLSYFFKNTGISYQLYEKGKKEDELLISRVDMTWLGANTHATIVTKNTGTATDNFYNTTQKGGVTNVRSFGDLEYRDIYRGIDLHYYYKNGSLKYDFIVAPGADYKNIKIKVEGATSIKQNEDGTLSITTPNGVLAEGMPVAFQEGREVKTSWMLENDVISFRVAGYNPMLPLVIDPLVYQWTSNFGASTGNNLVTQSYDDNVVNSSGNLHLIYSITGSGPPNSSSIYHVSGAGAYYGLSTSIFGGFGLTSKTQDLSISGNHLYVCGIVNSPYTVATTGAYQTTIAGQYDGFLEKFDTSGTKLWGTFYGGTSNDIINSAVVDSAGNIFICGETASAGMSSPGAQQSALAGTTDAFVAKFASGNGFRTWGTYFGGTAIDSAKSIDVRGNRIYISGNTNSSSGIATTGAHQTALAGNLNGFLLCKDTSGVTQWSTYYGSDTTYDENCRATATAVYLTGSTKATTNIATTGAHQSANAGGFDGFAARFDLTGVRQWGTYYGGANNDFVYGTTLGADGRLYICGATKSTSGISSPNSYNQTFVASAFAWGQDIGVAYLAELDANGQRTYGTYFNDGTAAYSCSANGNGDIFMSGKTAIDLGDFKAFVTRFNFNNLAVPVVAASTLSFCANSSSLLTTPLLAGVTYQWYRNNILIPGATGNTYTATQAGSYHVVLSQSPTATSLPVTLAVFPVPATVVSKTDVPCLNAAIGSITITPSGGTTPYSYVWDNSSDTTPTLSGLIPGSYTVHTSDANACTKTDTVIILNTNNNPSSLTTHTNVPCYGDSVATITVTTTGGTTPYEYVWDNLSNVTSYIDSLGTGTYIVHTTDINNCSDVDTITITQNTSIDPSDPLVSICAVTVDSASGKNVIIWKKEGNVKATAYNIYKESTVAGQYDLIGTNDVNDPTIFIDAASIPLQQSYSYKIAEVDSCDHEWPLSELHKTIHLSANVGINGEINLNWNTYEGKPYTTHRIMRSFNGGPFTLLNEVSGTITAYSDLTPPIGNSVYRIMIDLGTVCDTLNSQYITSNKLSFNTTGINDARGNDAIQIVPNPTTGIINILGNTPDKIQLYDAVGRLLLEEKNVNKLDISKFSKGIFMIRLVNKSGDLYYSQKVVLK